MVTTETFISLTILSLFCAGGLYAYLREVLRLKRLMSLGTVARATVLRKEQIDSGSESVVHYLVTYQFVDCEGKNVVHQQDLNSKEFFDSLHDGDPIEVLYQRGSAGNSYPLSQVKADRKIAQWICAGILLFWGGMGLFFCLSSK